MAACADLDDLFGHHHLLDAIIEEIDGRRIRVGERWLIDFASCNYLGLDLDREVTEAIPAYLDEWGTHPSWSRMLGSPALYRQMETRLTELLGSADSLLLPTLTHIHASVIPVLASDGTVFVDFRAHRTIWDGCVAARGHRGPLRPRRPRGPGAGPAPHPRAPPPGLHGRGQLDDRQPAPAPPRSWPWPGPTTPTGSGSSGSGTGRRSARTTAAATGSCATWASATTTSYSPAASPRPTRRCWPSWPARPSSSASARSPPPRVPLLGPVPGGVAGQRPGRPPGQRGRGDDLRTVLWARTRRVLDHLDKLEAFTLNRSGFPIIEVPLADPHDLARAGRFLLDHGIYVTLAFYLGVPREEVGFRIQVTAANTDDEVTELLAALDRLADAIPLRRRLARPPPSPCASVSAVALSDRLADQPTGDGVPSPPPGGRWRTPLRLAVAGVFLAVIAIVLAGQWRQARPLLGRLSVPVVLAAWALVLAGIYATFRSWRAALADLGGSLPHAGSMRVFYVGQLGKYLPGTIWPAVTQMRLGRDYRVPPRASGAAVVVFMLMLIGTGLLVGVAVIPLLGRDAVDEYRWLVLVLPVCALALAPPVLNRVLATALRVARRPPMPAPLSLGGILRVAGWALVSWLCYGVHVYLLVRQLGVDGGALLWLQCTGAFAAAFASGPLLLIVPAGAGVREGALLLLLGSTVGAPVAAVVAVVSRLLFIVGDLAWAAVAVLAARRLVRPAGTLPRPS